MDDLVDIQGYEGSYAITKSGQIWSYPKKRKPRGSWLKPGVTKDGYQYVNLSCYREDGRKYRTHIVARLVLETFHRAALDGEEADHKDFNRCNNHVDNLQWLSHKDNVQRSVTNKDAKGEKNSRAFLSNQDVLGIRKDRENGLSYGKLSSKWGIEKSHVAAICTRKLWKHI